MARVLYFIHTEITKIFSKNKKPRIEAYFIFFLLIFYIDIQIDRLHIPIIF
jgi:hypothetical protein